MGDIPCRAFQNFHTSSNQICELGQTKPFKIFIKLIFGPKGLMTLEVQIIRQKTIFLILLIVSDPQQELA